MLLVQKSLFPGHQQANMSDDLKNTPNVLLELKETADIIPHINMLMNTLKRKLFDMEFVDFIMKIINLNRINKFNNSFININLVLVL